MSGHDLARELIAKHGTDRYPTVDAQALKALEELGELAGAILKGHSREAVAKEYADAGLALYALGDKLGIDLDQAMSEVVQGETRTFERPEATARFVQHVVDLRTAQREVAGAEAEAG